MEEGNGHLESNIRKASPGFLAAPWVIQSWSWRFGMVPTLVAATAPCLKIIRVGMPRTPYFAGVAGLSSTSTRRGRGSRKTGKTLDSHPCGNDGVG